MLTSDFVDLTPEGLVYLESFYRIHHTAYYRGYVSRKNKLGKIAKYSGRFGEGFARLLPNYHSTLYSYIEYWIK